MRERPGSEARGEAVFEEFCAKCHVLFGKGFRVGPDLDGVVRGDADYWIANVVHPNQLVKPEYAAVGVIRKDGTFVQEARVAGWTLRSGNVHDVAISKDPEQRYLYVADGNNQKIRILLRSDLSLISSFGHGGHEGGNFGEGTAIDVDSKGNVYVGETFEGKRVQRFNYAGMGPGLPGR